MATRKVRSVKKKLTDEERIRHREIRSQIETEKPELIAPRPSREGDTRETARSHFGIESHARIIEVELKSGCLSPANSLTGLQDDPDADFC